jgi:hypothetical protein
LTSGSLSEASVDTLLTCRIGSFVHRSTFLSPRLYSFSPSITRNRRCRSGAVSFGFGVAITGATSNNSPIDQAWPVSANTRASLRFIYGLACGAQVNFRHRLQDVVSNMRRRSAAANKRASSAHLDGTGSGFSDNLCENNLRLGLAILFHHAHVKIYTR